MRIECVECRALVEPTWSVDGAALVARCPQCNGESRAVMAGAVPAKTSEGTGAECPKCGLRPVTGAACARCGLEVGRMATWVASDTATDRLVVAWEDCITHWDDAAVHDHAASLALTLDEQPWLARKYRAILRDRPDDAIARYRLERIGKIAQAAVLATAVAPRTGGYRRGSSLAILLVLVLLIMGGLAWGLYLANQEAPAGATPTRTPAGTPAGTPASR
jgi:DNA-directed RNA polymerase subunit RPC12/RpoP